MLRSQVTAADIDRLVLTKRYELLLSMVARVSAEVDSTGLKQVTGTLIVPGIGPSPHPVVNDLLITETQERTLAFDEAVTALNRQIQRWSRPGVFTSMDTGVYINHPDKFDDLNVADLVDVDGEDLHILVPMVVVEELDGLKQRGESHLRWRAGYTLAVLDKVLPQPATPAQLQAASPSRLDPDGTSRAAVSIELLFDAPGHVRLPVNDDEIIDRLLTAQSLAGRPITLITYDTSQAFKARAAGLRAIRLKLPIENEPEPEPEPRDKTRQRRRHRVPQGMSTQADLTPAGSITTEATMGKSTSTDAGA